MSIYRERLSTKEKFEIEQNLHRFRDDELKDIHEATGERFSRGSSKGSFGKPSSLLGAAVCTVAGVTCTLFGISVCQEVLQTVGLYFGPTVIESLAIQTSVAWEHVLHILEYVMHNFLQIFGFTLTSYSTIDIVSSKIKAKKKSPLIKINGEEIK